MPFTTLDIGTFIDFHFYADDTLFISMYPDDTDEFFCSVIYCISFFAVSREKCFQKNKNPIINFITLMQLGYILGKPLRPGLTTNQQHHPVVNYIITFSRIQT